MKINSISASSIKTFEVCPRKFYYEYVLKKKQEPHPASLAGSCLHKIFENACNAVIKKEPEEKHDPFYFYDACIKEFKVQPTYHDIIRKMTQTCKDWGYMDLKHAQGFELEAKFSLPCKVEVRGYIDRLDIDWSNHSANIIDLKTQKDAFTKKELEHNWQAMIYFLATVNDNPMITQDVKISFWVLKHKIQEVFIPLSKFDEIFQKLNVKTEEILKADFEQTCPSGLCQFCIATDCIQKKKTQTFVKQDISKSAKEMTEFLQQLRNKKAENTIDSLE